MTTPSSHGRLEADDVDFGLTRILDGIEVLIAQRTKAP